MDIVERVCLVAADTVVVFVTIYHTYGTIKTSREVGIQATFSSTLLRAGQYRKLQLRRNMTRVDVKVRPF